MDNSYLLAYTDSTDVLIGKDLQTDDEYECKQFLKGNENELIGNQVRQCFREMAMTGM